MYKCTESERALCTTSRDRKKREEDRGRSHREMLHVQSAWVLFSLCCPVLSALLLFSVSLCSWNETLEGPDGHSGLIRVCRRPPNPPSLPLLFESHREEEEFSGFVQQFELALLHEDFSYITETRVQMSVCTFVCYDKTSVMFSSNWACFIWGLSVCMVRVYSCVGGGVSSSSVADGRHECLQKEAVGCMWALLGGWIQAYYLSRCYFNEEEGEKWFEWLVELQHQREDTAGRME